HAMTSGYERMKGFPKPGFAAGPCLFKDTMQLAAFSRNNFSLGHDAMLVNEGLVLHIIDRLRQQFVNLEQLTIGLLGMAFKPEVDDIRSSLSYKLKKMLLMHTSNVLVTDPFVVIDPGILPVEEVVDKSDILILCTPHKAYQSLDTKNKPVIDLSGFLQTCHRI
ncbi:UDP binding domain-containing protein, partial [Magnetococcales bacterium HHB-1]